MNNKNFVHAPYNTTNANSGWFIGSFLDKTDPNFSSDFEICYKEFKAGKVIKPHYHAEKIELIILLEGLAKFSLDGKEIEINAGEYLYIQPKTTTSAEFIEDSKLFFLHSPSLPKDKIVI